MSNSDNPLTFRWINTEIIHDFKNSTHYEDQIIDCFVRQYPTSEESKFIIYNTTQELMITLSRTWIHEISNWDGGFALLNGDDYIIKPTRYKYLIKESPGFFKHIESDIANRSIVRIDKIEIYGEDKIRRMCLSNYV
jgi:hypothetical protein